MLHAARAFTVMSLTVSLAACGGGGGNGGGGSSSGTSAAPVTSAVIPVPVPFQAANTSGYYQADSASATLVGTTFTGTRIDPASINNILGLNTDGAGNLSALQISVPTPSGSFIVTYTSNSQVAPTATNTSYLQFSASGTSYAELLTGLSYSRFGAWGSNDGGGAYRFGVVAYGSATPTGSIPTTGTATYIGYTAGYAADGNLLYALAGTVQVVANFSGAPTLTLTVANLTQANASTGATVVSGLSFNGSGSISTNRYSGTITGPVGSALFGSGTFVGGFYGPTAQETAGVWRTTGTTGSAIGSFGAKQ